jgi:hypothetical protein
MVFAKTLSRSHRRRDDSAASGKSITALSLVEVDAILADTQSSTRLKLLFRAELR